MIQHKHSIEKINILENQRFTPRELVKRMIKDPHYHVTDNDIQNVYISIKSSEKEKTEPDEGVEEFPK